MAGDSTHVLEAPRGEQRVLGRVRGADAGPSTMVLGGIHGNEPAGVEAARRVLKRLAGLGSDLRGEVAFLCGNLPALKLGHRFIDLDLNRIWTIERVSAVPAGDGEPVERGQQRELLASLAEIVGAARGRVHFLDLHTSSADGPPFVTVGDTLRNREFAQRLSLPLILGLEEQVDGALLEYLNNAGVVTLGVEAGRHDAPQSIDHHESVLWLVLVAAGHLPAEAVTDLEHHRRRLELASRGVPRVIEVRSRHAICNGDGFRMEQGYVNFQRVERGQLLARDRRGPIRAAESGLVLLPLYQGQGDDGFFISREVRGIWLRLSAVLRRLGLGGLMRFLPGVRPRPDEEDALEVDLRVARWYPLEIFHLFGFRKRRTEGPRLIVSRRRHDLEPPPVLHLSGGA